MPTKTSLNIELFKKIKKHLHAKPARLRMDNWVRRGEPNQELFNTGPGYGEPATFKLPSCGTVGCIAGWAYILAHPEIANDPTFGRFGGSINVASYASGDLGINLDFRPFELFYVTYWPEPYATDYPNAKTQKERTKIVCEVIDLFIQQYQDNEKEHARKA